MEQTRGMSNKRSAATSNNGSGIEIPDALAEQVEAFSERFEEANDKLVGFIKERPITALLVAGVGGYLIGRILR